MRPPPVALNTALVRRIMRWRPRWHSMPDRQRALAARLSLSVELRAFNGPLIPQRRDWVPWALAVAVLLAVLATWLCWNVKPTLEVFP